ncbi:MAG: hypothetical protein ACOC8A_01135 [bacterium]
MDISARASRAACCALLVVALGSVASALGAGRVAPIDLAAHAPDDEADLRRLGEGLYEWRLPEGKAQTLHIDLAAQGIEASRYDELRFEIKPLGSQVGLRTAIGGLPEAGEVSRWYLKFKALTGEWASGRYDLRLDDDGYLGRGQVADGVLELRLSRRVVGFPGEPAWRRALIRRPRFVRRLVDARFDLLEAEVHDEGGDLEYVYPLHVANRTDRRLEAALTPDSRGTLHYFRAEAPERVPLEAGERATVPIRLRLPRRQAMARAPLYAEPAFPRVAVEGAPDGDTVPLMGYRAWPMWGAVPVYNRTTWSPVEFQAFIAARAKALPGIGEWRERAVRAADAAMEVDWVVPPLELLPAGFDQSYRCGDCGKWLRPLSPTDFRHHQCPRCGRRFEGSEKLDKAYASRYLGRAFGAARTCALAWLLTGRETYGRKAVGILERFAARLPAVEPAGLRSTAGGSRLVFVTLHASYKLPALAEAWWLLADAPFIEEQTRATVSRFLVEEASRLARHSVEYSNQQAEHLRAYGSAGLATGFWPLAAEAVHGEFGWHELVEFGYTEEGIAHEAGAYHRALFGAMVEFAGFAHDQGVELLSPRFRRVFDGSLLLDRGSGASYELAYRVYRRPAYLGVLAGERRRPGEATALRGLLGVPEAASQPVRSAHFPGTGYLFLRTGHVADNREIRVNYIKPFDRHERDKLTTFFYRNGRQVDGTVGRITYSSPHSAWMLHSAAHNTIVVDGASQEPVDARLVAADLEAPCPIAVVATDPQAPLYPGVSQLRGIALVDGAYVVFDRVEAERPRTIDRYQYGRGEATLDCDAPPVPQLDHVPERGRFCAIHGGPCGKELRAHWPNGLRMRLVADRPFAAYKAHTVGGYQARPMEVTCARAAEAREVTFLAAFTFGDEAEPPHLRIRHSSPQRLVLEVEGTEATTVLTVEPPEKQVRAARSPKP